MKRKVLIASLLTFALVAVGGSAVAWASSARQVAPPLTGNLAAMHGACLSGNAEAMRAAIDNMTPEDWQAMAGQMTAHMRGGGTGGGMMSTQSAQGGMMGSGAGMLGSGGDGGMMGGAGMMGSGAGTTF